MVKNKIYSTVVGQKSPIKLTITPAEAKGYRVDLYKTVEKHPWGEKIATLDSKWFPTRSKAIKEYRRKAKTWL